MIEGTKLCVVCGAEKPTNEFHRHSGYKDGRRPICKACRLETPRVIELDVPAGWPPGVKQMVREIAVQLDDRPLGSLGYMDELFECLRA
jgi:hypothetical protein